MYYRNYSCVVFFYSLGIPIFFSSFILRVEKNINILNSDWAFLQRIVFKKYFSLILQLLHQLTEQHRPQRQGGIVLF